MAYLPRRNALFGLSGNFGKQGTGGRGGIRTHGELPPTAVFKTAALNHSATRPDCTGASLLPMQWRQRKAIDV